MNSDSRSIGKAAKFKFGNLRLMSVSNVRGFRA